MQVGVCIDHIAFVYVHGGGAGFVSSVLCDGASCSGFYEPSRPWGRGFVSIHHQDGVGGLGQVCVYEAVHLLDFFEGPLMLARVIGAFVPAHSVNARW